MFDLSSRDPVIVGMGLIALDAVISERDEQSMRLWAGGTCGNVLAILSYLGWTAYPVARLNGDTASKYVSEDLDRWGVRRDFASLQPGSRTPVVVQRIRRNADGKVFHKFSRRCPVCGSWLPGYTPVPASHVEGIFEQVGSLKVFFFDRASSGALALAKASADKGAIVFFEPSSMGNPRLFREAVTVSHVLKYSEERMAQSNDVLSTAGPLLRIETLGSEGLRYQASLPGRGTTEWKHLDAYAMPQVRDASGAGDWLTAGIIHRLGQMALEGFQSSTPAQLEEGLRFGQALAAWNCGFEGARGGMYAPDYARNKKTFHAAIDSIISGHSLVVPALNHLAIESKQVFQSICPTCGDKSRSTINPAPIVQEADFNDALSSYCGGALRGSR